MGLKIEEPRKIGCMSGSPTTTSIPVVVASLSSSDITVTLNGESKIISTAGIGTPVAGYHGDVVFTGLTKLTRYLVTITQDGNTETQYAWTAPEKGDDFIIAFASCDNNTSFTSIPSSTTVTLPRTKYGAWRYIRGLIDSNGLIDGIPCIGVWFVDDHGYISNTTYPDYFEYETGSPVTGNAIASQSIPSQILHNYAIGWLGNFGLLATVSRGTFPGGQGIGQIEDFPEWGRNEDRLWCYANLNRIPAYGDWEFSNDMGWSFSTTDNVIPSGEKNSPKNRWDAGLACWDAFMRPLQGVAMKDEVGALDTAANHQYLDLGDLRILTPDFIYNDDTPFDTNTETNHMAPEGIKTTLLGNGQIDDLLKACKSDHAFKMFGMANGIKYMQDTLIALPDSGNMIRRGTQHPIKNHQPTEYSRLFTSDSGIGDKKSLMDSPETNGLTGTFFCVHGDHHVQKVYKHGSPATAGNLAENFYGICVGTINGSIGHGHSGIVTGQTYDGTENEFTRESLTALPKEHGAILVKTLGSRVNKECHVELTHLDNIVWNKKFVHKNYHNDAVDVNKVTNNEVGVAAIL